jgi:ABC-type transport system substrate-binding protein
VQTDLNRYAQSVFFNDTSAGILRGGHYDVAFGGMSTGPDPDHSDIYSGHNLSPSGGNTTRWNNPVATAAMDDALKTVDQARRRRDYVVVQQQLTRDVPTIFLNFVRVPFVYNDDLHGFDPSPVIPPFWDPWNYSI